MSKDIKESSVDPVERVQRKVRGKKVGKDKKKPEPTVRRDAEPVTKKKNDPNNTAYGKGSLRGSKHKWINKRKSRDYHRAEEFLLSSESKPIYEVIENLSDIDDFSSIVQLIDRLLEEETKFDDNWLSTIRDTVVTIAEARGMRSEPFVVKIGDEEGQKKAERKMKSLLRQDMYEMFTHKWIEKVIDRKHNIIRYFAVAEQSYGDRLRKAEENPNIEIIKIFS